jgi:hypothetical protein
MKRKIRDKRLIQKCEKPDISMVNTVFITGMKRNKRKGHRNMRPCRTFPAYIWANPGNRNEIILMTDRFSSVALYDEPGNLSLHPVRQFSQGTCSIKTHMAPQDMFSHLLHRIFTPFAAVPSL